MTDRKERQDFKWFPCPVCIYNHPFEVSEERPCPNLALSPEQTQKIFHKGNVFCKPLGPHERKAIEDCQ